MDEDLTIKAAYLRKHLRELDFDNQVEGEVKSASKEGFRVETQMDFTGRNDIQRYKILEARKIWKDLGIHTLVVHFDFLHRQVALLKLDEINEEDEHWLKRVFRDDGWVYNIDPECFVWDFDQVP